MAIIAIESALDVAITFGDTELVKIYQEALAEAGVEYVSTANAGLNKKGCLIMDYFTAKEMLVLGIVLGASLVLIFTLILKGEM